MPTIKLAYGKSTINFAFDENQFEIIGKSVETSALTDIEIGAKLDNPIDSKPLEEIINAGESVLIVVPDATRQTASGQIVNLLVRRLIAGGTMPFDIRIIFATGIHRRVTDAEKRELLTPFIHQRIKTLDHNARDLAQIVRIGETDDGIPIAVNRALLEHDHVIIVGGISFHYFAGFTGGRKLICPGLASSQTISATHKLAFDCEIKSRRKGVGTGLLDGNAVHEAFTKVVAKIPPTFSINTIVNDKDETVDLFCGNWLTAHQTACDAYAAQHTIEIAEKRDLVIVSGGGFPFDTNLIQAHKALDAAAKACTDGGTIIFLAECAEGLGRSDFLDWFQAENSSALAEKLCAKYQVNGQTAWSLLRKTEKFNIKILTSLPEETTRSLKIQKARNIEDGIINLAEGKSYIVPFGAKFLIKS
jgi:nickel-dependent lactate racemase